MPRFGPFHELVGPFYWKQEGEQYSIGMQILDKHRAKGPFIHGGMLAMLMDTAFMWVTRRLYDASVGIVTTNLSIDYVAGAISGDWIEARVDVVRSGKRLTFLSAYVWKGDERIARANAQFLTVDRSRRPLLE